MSRPLAPTRVVHPAEEPVRVAALAAVLASASTTALRVWQPERADIYHCAQRAWRAHNIPVPFAAVTRALRRVVPDGANLLDYNDGDGRTRRDIADLFLAARDEVARPLGAAVGELEDCGRAVGGVAVAPRAAVCAQLSLLDYDLAVGA
jgi:hypothetical protein